MKRILTPDQAIAYFSIVLDELSLDPYNESSVFCSEFINLDFAGIAMPAIQIDPPLTFEQRALIGQLCDKNRDSKNIGLRNSCVISGTRYRTILIPRTFKMPTMHGEETL
jgi:hypothetical protein